MPGCAGWVGVGAGVEVMSGCVGNTTGSTGVGLATGPAPGVIPGIGMGTGTIGAGLVIYITIPMTIITITIITATIATITGVLTIFYVPLLSYAKF